MEHSYKNNFESYNFIRILMSFNSIQTYFFQNVFKMKQTIICDEIILQNYQKLFSLTLFIYLKLNKNYEAITENSQVFQYFKYTDIFGFVTK